MTDPKPKANPTEPKPKAGPLVGVALVLAICAALLPSEDRKLKPYLDSAGIPTVCMGIIGKDVIAGKTYTVPECEALEQKYVAKMVRDMSACVPANIRSQLTTGEWIAYSHWAYNTGTGAFCRSTLNTKLSAGNRVGACKAMGAWTYITYKGRKRNCRDADMKRICGGIVTRRDMEVSMCMEALS